MRSETFLHKEINCRNAVSVAMSLLRTVDKVLRVNVRRIKSHQLDGEERLGDTAEQTAVSDGVSFKFAIDWNSEEADELALEFGGVWRRWVAKLVVLFVRVFDEGVKLIMLIDSLFDGSEGTNGIDVRSLEAMDSRSKNICERS
jgi:hypothetical protein